MNTNDNASIEIDVLYLLKKLWSKKFFIIFVGLLVGTIALLGSVFFIKPNIPLRHVSTSLAVAAIQVLLTKTSKRALTWLTTTKKLSHQVKFYHQLLIKKNFLCQLVNYLMKLQLIFQQTHV